MFNPSYYQRLLLLVGSLLLALYLLLVQNRIEFSSPLLAALWDRAHVFLFALLTLIFDFALLRQQRRNLKTRAWLLLPPLLALAVITEALQSLTERTASWGDVGFNVIGIALASLQVLLRHHAHNRWQRYLCLTGFTLILVASMWQPLRWIFAYQQLRHDFPLLSNMERSSDSLLWGHGERVPSPERTATNNKAGNDDHTAPSHDGAQAWQIRFSEQPYSGVSMRHFPTDWREYQSLHIALYNPQTYTLPLSLRIHDRQHEQGVQAHADRFNYDIDAAPGWTELSIKLSKVTAAPRNRTMDMAQITQLRIYARQPQKNAPRLLIDDVYLQ